LKQLSRLEKTRNTILLLFVALMAISLVLFYAPARNTDPGANLTRSQDTAATVGSETITVGDVAIEQQNMAQQMARQYAQFGAQFTPPPTPAKTVLNNEISNRLIRLEAARLGLTPSDQEVAANIRQQLKAIPGFDLNDKEAYRRLATENVGSVERLEQSVRDDLTQKKLAAFLTSGVQISEDEIVDTYKHSATSFDLVYVPISSPALALKLQPSDAELHSYFDQNKSRYYISTPQKKIRYLFINQSKVGEKLDVAEADLRAEYDALAPDKKQKGIEAQQIVLKLAADGKNEAAVSEKANKLAQEARKDGDKSSEEAFANLARGNSGDNRTAPNGGKIAGLVRPNPNNPDDPLQKILALEEGQVTEPIKFGSSYYIFRRGRAVPKTFEDAKQELLVSLRNRRAYKAAADIAQKADARLKEIKDVRKVAEEFAPQVNMKPDEMVRETGFIKPGDEVANVGIAPQFEEGIAPLEAVGEVGEVTPIKDGFAIPALVDKREPRDAEFDEVKDQVANALKIDQARGKVEQVANEIAANASSPDALKAAAEKYGLKAADAKDYKLGSPLGEGATSASSPVLDEAIYNLKAGEVTKTPIKSGENYFVVGTVKRTEANMEEFAKQRDQLVETALQTKKGQLFGDYLRDLRQKMEKEGRIKIYQDALAKIDGSKTAADEEN
ncbi:MAG: peptidyl-prolyl cis-trans isomerase, partial [Pyrinomonadaceae bacterium]